MSLRATQGLLASVFRLMQLELPIPDYTTVSRRQAALDVSRADCQQNLTTSVRLLVTSMTAWVAPESRGAECQQNLANSVRLLDVSMTAGADPESGGGAGQGGKVATAVTVAKMPEDGSARTPSAGLRS